MRFLDRKARFAVVTASECKRGPQLRIIRCRSRATSHAWQVGFVAFACLVGKKVIGKDQGFSRSRLSAGEIGSSPSSRWESPNLHLTYDSVSRQVQAAKAADRAALHTGLCDEAVFQVNALTCPQKQPPRLASCSRGGCASSRASVHAPAGAYSAAKIQGSGKSGESASRLRISTPAQRWPFGRSVCRCRSRFPLPPAGRTGSSARWPSSLP